MSVDVSPPKKDLYFFDYISQKYKIISTDEQRKIFCVDLMELYQHGSWPMSVPNLHVQMLYYRMP